jgi:hypothetical protein
VEVKASSLARPAITRSLRSFIRSYRPASATVVNLSLDAESDVDGTPVRFLPFPACLTSDQGPGAGGR